MPLAISARPLASATEPILTLTRTAWTIHPVIARLKIAARSTHRPMPYAAEA